MSTRKPARPGLPSGREAIAVPGLPAPTPTPNLAPSSPPIPAPYPGVQGYGQVRTPRARKSGTAKREDPAGMARTSYYISEGAAAALDNAVEQVLKALGGDVPKHVALSALITAGAAQAGNVAAQLAATRAAELAKRLESLRQSGADSH